MYKLFKYERSINSLLYSLSKFGGKTDMHKLCKILYFADQKHLSEYGRSITGDTYIAMQYGPVPSCVDDILKALRGDGFFSDNEGIANLRKPMHFENRFIVAAAAEPDMDELSLSGVECLDYAIELCRNKNFQELTNLSHWHGAIQGVTERSPSKTFCAKSVMNRHMWIIYRTVTNNFCPTVRHHWADTYN